MKVRANVNLNYDGIWHHTGEEFEIARTDADMLGDMVEMAETPIEPEHFSDPPVMNSPRRGRKTKNA